MKLNFKFNDRNAKLALINGRVAVLGVLMTLITLIIWIVAAVQYKSGNLKLKGKPLNTWTIVMGVITLAAGVWLIIASRKMDEKNNNGVLLGCGVSCSCASLALFVIAILFEASELTRVNFGWFIIGLTALIMILLLVPLFISINKISKNL